MKSFVVLLLCVGTVFQHSDAFVNRPRNQNNKIESMKSGKYSATSPATKSQYKGSEKIQMKILRNEIKMKPNGAYNYIYETSNGILGMEEGVGGVSVKGNSSYVSPEGVEIKMTYTADENGYHPVGDHIPKMPDYIVRALEYIRTHPFKVKKSRSENIERIETVTPFKLLTEIAPPTLTPTAAPPHRRFVLAPKKKKFTSEQKLAQSNYKKKRF